MNDSAPYISMNHLISKRNGKQIIDFPDENFRTHLIKYYDFDNDGEISIADALQITNLTLSGRYNNGYYEGLNIKSLIGIEFFENLESLQCHNNELISLNLSHNKKLINLACQYNNKLENIDIRGCLNLKRINCSFTNISQLNIFTNRNLTEIFCSGCKITFLDCTKNTSLQYLSCYSNKLEGIDISHNELLESLNIRFNRLTNLDISQNKKLKFLHCGNNLLTDLDVSSNIELESLNYHCNSISNVDTSKNKILIKKIEEIRSNPESLSVKGYL